MAAELTLFQAVERFRAAVLRGERASAARLVRAYGQAYARLLGDIEALIRAIGELPGPTLGQVERLSLYRALLAGIEREIDRYAVIAENEIAESTRAALAAGLRDSARLAQIALPALDPAQMRALWRQLNPDAVTTMLGFLEADSPLYLNLRRLGQSVADATAEALRNGIALGWNPRKVARIIRDSAGQGLTWSLNTARTANLWTYRLTSHAAYLKNSHVVKGWIWIAELGPRTCLSCINQHGSEHTLDETLNDHHAGRCAPAPITASYADLGFGVRGDSRPAVRRGEDWFRGLSAQEQRAMMGPGMWKAWKAGAFDFRDLSQPYTNDVYGEMLREASLKGLLGDRARAYGR